MSYQVEYTLKETGLVHGPFRSMAVAEAWRQAYLKANPWLKRAETVPVPGSNGTSEAANEQKEYPVSECFLVVDPRTREHLVQLNGQRYQLILGSPFQFVKEMDGIVYECQIQEQNGVWFWHCTCEAYHFGKGKPCKHLYGLELLGFITL